MSLAHTKLSTTLGEADLVHQLVDEKDPASASFEHVCALERVRHPGHLKSWPRITDDDQHVARVIVRHQTLDGLRGIALAAVADRIGERFLQRQLDLELMPGDPGLIPERLRDTFGHRIDSDGVSGNYDVELAGRAEW